MEFKQGYDKGWFAVFKDSESAKKWEWLFYDIFGMRISSFGQYDNAYEIVSGTGE